MRSTVLLVLACVVASCLGLPTLASTASEGPPRLSPHGGQDPAAPRNASEGVAQAGAGACAGLLALLPVEPGRTEGDRLAFRSFYAARDCRPAWSPSSAAALLAEVRSADRDGLDPAAYGPARIAALLEGGGDPALLDALLTDAFLRYARHLTSGRVDPATLGPEWNVQGRGRDLVLLLGSALGGGHLPQTLAGLAPPTPAYAGLREALAAMRATAAAGGWPAVPPGRTLHPGDRDARVPALRARLAREGAVPPGTADPEVFDGRLATAVEAFQRRHGLDPDGVVGPRTLAALEVTAAGRARQIAANLERLRWLPRELGPRRVVVNIPDFSLEAFEGGRLVTSMRVIAGRDARRTPFFAGEITSIVFNPTWTVPLKIALEDKLPLILESRDWLAEQGVRVYRRDGKQWREALPGEVQWITLGPGNFPLRLVQDPGPKNALGRIKFQIPNPHDIYLHDTPSRELFALAERTFSSGCIRVERPRELAELLLRPDPSWDRRGIDEAIQSGTTREVRLPQPLPVYLLYWTAWVDGQGVLQLREDVYGLDAPLARALALPDSP